MLEPKRKGLADPPDLHSMRLHRQRHRRGADVEFDDGDIEIAGGEEVADGLKAHCGNE